MSKAKRKTRFDGTEGDCYEFIEKMAYPGNNPWSVKILVDCVLYLGEDSYQSVRFLRIVDRLGLWGDRMWHLTRARGLEDTKDIVSIVEQLGVLNAETTLSQGAIINCRKLDDFVRFFDRIPI